MLWRVHRRTVNPSPCGKHSWFDSKLLHQIGLKVFMDARMPVTHKEGDRYPLGPPSFFSSVRTKSFFCSDSVLSRMNSFSIVQYNGRLVISSGRLYRYL